MLFQIVYFYLVSVKMCTFMYCISISFLITAPYQLTAEWSLTFTGVLMISLESWWKEPFWPTFYHFPIISFLYLYMTWITTSTVTTSFMYWRFICCRQYLKALSSHLWPHLLFDQVYMKCRHYFSHFTY